MKRILFFLALICAPTIHAQITPIHGAGDPRSQSPIPSCVFNRLYVDDISGTVYSASGYPCTWAPVSGGGSSVTLANGFVIGTGTGSSNSAATNAQLTVTVNGVPCLLGSSCTPSNATSGTAIPTAVATSPATYFQTGVQVGNSTVTDTWNVSPNGYNWVNLRTGAVSRANALATGNAQYVGTTVAHYAFADGLASAICADSSANAFTLDCSHVSSWSAPITTATINSGGATYLPGAVATIVQSGGSGGTFTVTGVLNTGTCVTSTATPGAVCSGTVSAAGATYQNGAATTTGGTGTGLTLTLTAGLGITINNVSAAYVKLPLADGLIGPGVGEILCGTFPSLGGVFGSSFAQAMLSASYDVSAGAWSANTPFAVNVKFLNAGTWYLVNTAYTSGATFGSLDTTNASVSTVPTQSPSRLYGLLARGGYIGAGFNAGNAATNEPILATGTTEGPFTIPASTYSCLGFYSDGSNAALNQLYSGYQQVPSYAVKQTFPTTTITQATLGNLRSDSLNNVFTPGATYVLWHSFHPLTSGPSLTEQMQANLAQAAQDLSINKGITVIPSFLGANNSQSLLDCSGSSIVVGFNSSAADYALGACGYVMKQLGTSPTLGGTVSVNGLSLNVVDHGVGSASYTTASTFNSILNTQLPGIVNLKQFYGIPGAQCVVFVDAPTNDIKAVGATGAVAWASYQQAAAMIHGQGCRVIGTTMVNRSDCTSTCATNQAALNVLIRANWTQNFDTIMDLAADPRFNIATAPTSTGAWVASTAYTAGQFFTFTPSGGTSTNFTVVTGYTSGTTWQGCDISTTGQDCVNTSVDMFSDGIHWSSSPTRNGGGYEVAGQYLLAALTRLGFVSRNSAVYAPAASVTPVFDCSQGLNTFTLTANITPSFINWAPGSTCDIELIENATGGFNWTLPTFVATSGGGVAPQVVNAPTLVTTAGAINYVKLTIDGYGALNGLTK